MNRAIFYGDSQNGRTPVYQLTADDAVRELTSFPDIPVADDDLISMAPFNGRYYCIDPSARTVRRTTGVRGGFTDSNQPVELTLSRFGGNTPLIEKTLYQVSIELSEAVPDLSLIHI